MDIYHLWYVKRAEQIQGPFPEALVCRFIALGRIVATDEVSLDRTFWHKAADVPELTRGVEALLAAAPGEGSADPEWGEERAKAVRRWLDDRKSPDPRTRQAQGGSSPGMERRSGRERRQNPETVEQQVYREWRGEFESGMRRQRQRYGLALSAVLLMVLIALLFAFFYRPVNPIKVGLVVAQIDCAAAPSRGVNWSGCRKDDAILAGADLRGAELVGTSLKRANLRHADLARANLASADLAGADLAGARLGDAIWIDGRVCAAGSVGGCR